MRGLFDIETTKIMGEMAKMEYTMMRGIQSAFSSTILMRGSLRPLRAILQTMSVAECVMELQKDEA